MNWVSKLAFLGRVFWHLSIRRMLSWPATMQAPGHRAFVGDAGAAHVCMYPVHVAHFGQVQPETTEQLLESDLLPLSLEKLPVWPVSGDLTVTVC